MELLDLQFPFRPPGYEDGGGTYWDRGESSAGSFTGTILIDVGFWLAFMVFLKDEESPRTLESETVSWNLILGTCFTPMFWRSGRHVFLA